MARSSITAGAASDANNHLHVLDGTQRVAIVRIGPAEPGDTTPAVQYQLSDHLGSSTAVVDDTGALINSEDFTPYGETSFGSFAKKRYRFTGMERDEESSLSYHGARYYAPWLARWSSSDPIGWQGGMNLYGYAHQNPIASSDPSGLDPDVNAFNQEIDKNGDNLITKQELDSGLECSTMTRDSWLNQMAFDHRYTVDASLKREIDARLTSVASAAWDEALRRAERARENPFSGHDGPRDRRRRNLTMSTAEHEAWGTMILHPSARIWRDEKTLAVSAVSLWQPEVFGGAQIVHGAATGDDDEAADGVTNLFLSWALRNVSRSGTRTEPTSYRELRNAGEADAHHTIQDAAVRDIPGYKTSEAPAVKLEGPSNRVGSPHYEATQVQRQPGGGTYAAERRIGYKAFRAAGFSPSQARSAIEIADIYFVSLGVTTSTPTRIPGNR